MISVIVPVYNGEAVIGRCLSSLLAQTYVDFEILVIDDGSEDATAREVRSFSDPRIRLFRQKNAGVSAARNLGIENAMGEYIVFVDGDDYVESAYLMSLYLLREEGALSAVGFTGSAPCDAADTEETKYLYEIGQSMPDDLLAGTLGKTIAFSCWNKLFARQILIDNELRFPVGLKLGEDLIFVFRYLCYCRRVVYCGKAQYHYCENSDSAVRRAADRSDDYEATVSMMQTIRENGYSFHESAICSFCLEIMTYVLQNPYVSEMNYADFKEYLRKLGDYRIRSLALRAARPCGYKRRAFHWALRRRFAFAIFVLIRANGYLWRWAHRDQRKKGRT